MTHEATAHSAPSSGAPAASPVSAATRRRVISASFIGNFVEWFDYAIYGYLAATIAVVFFPDSWVTSWAGAPRCRCPS